jgi:uncharacterized protein (DUF58 family)
MIPGDAELPSFSASRGAEHADRMLAHMYDADRDGIRMLLGVFRFLPSLAVRILRLCDHEARFPDPIRSVLRMVSIGVKGVVMTLYTRSR